MMRLPVIVAALVVLAGCSSSREAAASAIIAQQANQGIAKIATAPEIGRTLATMTPEQRATLEPALRTIVDLANQAAASLSPVVARLTVDEPAAEVRTSPEMAATRPREFIADAQRQEVRAEVEVEHAKKVSALWQTAAEYGATVGDSLLSQVLLGGGGLGALVAAGFGIVKSRGASRTIQDLKGAVVDAVAFGKEALEVNPSDEDAVQALKDKHRAKQIANRTNHIIKQAKA